MAEVLSEKLCGVITEYNDVSVKCVLRQARNFASVISTPPTIDDVPSRVELVFMCAKAKAGKGCAESEGGSGCVVKRGDKYVILNNKKGGVWKSGFSSAEEAKKMLSAYHANS